MYRSHSWRPRLNIWNTLELCYVWKRNISKVNFSLFVEPNLMSIFLQITPSRVCTTHTWELLPLPYVWGAEEVLRLLVHYRFRQTLDRCFVLHVRYLTTACCGSAFMLKRNIKHDTHHCFRQTLNLLDRWFGTCQMLDGMLHKQLSIVCQGAQSK